jgi:hypothetical protein
VDLDTAANDDEFALDDISFATTAVQNGDVSQGNIDFSSDYNFVNPISSVNEHTVAANPRGATSSTYGWASFGSAIPEN